MPPGPSSTPSAGRAARPARTALAAGGLGPAVLATAVGLALSAGCGPGASRPSGAATAGAGSPSAAALAEQMARTRAAPPVTLRVATSTELATVRRAALRYASPGRLATGTVPASWYRRPSVLPVIAAEPGWVEVRLAQRPNESTAWLPATDVTL